MMDYDRQILQILTEVGQQGIGVRQLAKHVYNLNCTLFFQPDLHEIYRYVQKFVKRNSKVSKSLVEHTGRWGYYRLNMRNDQARQFILQYRQQSSKEEEEKEEKPQIDTSLSLFDF